MFIRSLTLFGVLASFLIVAETAHATTITLDATRLGYTSRGGINQARAVPITGTFRTYGDVFKSHYIFDLAQIKGRSVTVDSVTLQLGVHSFISAQNETLSVEGYSGDLTVLKTDNFKSPTFSTNRTIYPNFGPVSLGSRLLDANTKAGDLLSIAFNAEGLSALQTNVDGSGGSEVAFGTSFGIPVWAPQNRYLGTTTARLVIDYSDKTPTPAAVPLPASGVLLFAGLFALFRIRRG
ncbi:hypothetical protein [uncultured Roseovarius sp.]|uniref:hypothetical protein n=1 Tax=uncultured Roseovarius sp. TaxID=293344 RepID=UPI002617880E|nr:hypothetical protein [uncultured Roseovarius sp.]